MYGIISCPNCGNSFIVEGDPETTKCGRCRKAIKYRRARKRYKAENIGEARKALAILNATRDNRKEEFVNKIKESEFFEKDVMSGGGLEKESNTKSDETKIKQNIRNNEYTKKDLKNKVNEVDDNKIDKFVEEMRLRNELLVRRDNVLELV
jgi:hypothetical protein